MSRLIVKNLPTYLDDAALKAHFSARGHVTDVKLMRRPDGTSRRFGFVGYSSEDDARSALEYFNRTFIDTTRINVELAKKVNDPELEEANARKRKAGAAASDSGPPVPPSGPGRPAHTAYDPLAAGTLPPPKKKTKSAAASAADSKPAKTNGATSGGGSREVTFDEFFAALAPKAKKGKTYHELNGGKLDDVSVTNGALSEAAPKKKKKEKKQDKTSSAAGSAPQPSTSDSAVQDNAVDAQADADADADADNVTERDDALEDEGLTDMDYLARRMKRRIGDDIDDAMDEGAADQDAEKSKGAAFEQSDDEMDEDDDASSITTDPEVERTRQALAERARKDEENVDALMASSRIFVRNLPFSASSEDIEHAFGKYGDIAQVHIPLDKETKSPKGVAFVTFSDPTHAVAAFRALDGSTFQGRLLHLIPAVEKHGAGAAGTSSADGAAAGAKAKPDTLKQSKLKERRTLAGKDFNWSTLYMNPDAVATSVADRLGISKSDILNPDSVADGQAKSGSSAAVRLALAETRVIQETKDFLIAHGINLDAFNDRHASDVSGNGAAKDTKKPSAPVERSETTMLVKNIPYGTTSDEIRALFARHGEVAQVLLPPAGTLAIVQMLVPGEARVAFRALAYRRFKDSVLYLEKAPGDLFEANPNAEAGAGKGAAAAALKGKEAPASKAALKLSGAADAANAGTGADAGEAAGSGNLADAAPGATLFVKNLNFATTDAGLSAAFAALPDFAFARIQTKPAPAPAANQRSDRTAGAAPLRADGKLSMGFGFAVFKSADAAQRAQKAMDGYLLDGHTLNVKFAKRGHDADDAPASSMSKSTSSTKLMVKNLPFETTKKDVRELFAAHGQVRSVRLPKRIDNRPRGFAFVEFVSHREAEAAKEALKHTRLLGRHLVIGWPDEGAAGGSGGVGSSSAGLDALRAKEAVVHGGNGLDGGVAGKKSKLRMNEQDIADAVAAEKRRRAEEDDDDDDDDSE
ncbi:Multiple RNA-binding domain-containing protein 1 [Tilletia horrida]|nr:Multiple RNA-binding domain-containing protein 1 [Tilletia horrida]